MTRAEYFEHAQNLFSKDRISEDVFWAMIENADEFVDKESSDEIQSDMEVSK